MVRDELRLQGAEVLGIGREVLDGLHAVAVGLDRQQQAAADGFSVEQHGARAAHPVFAAQVRAGQSKDLAQQIGQAEACLDRCLAGLAVDRQRDRASVHG